MIRVDLPAAVVAEAPPPGGCGPLGPLDGDAGDRLAAAADLPRERLLGGLVRFNLIVTPGHGVSEPWDARRAVDAARALLVRPEGDPLSLRGRVVLLAGQRVLRAFAATAGFPSRLPPLSRLSWLETEWVPLPHPSGRCRWWNDRALRAAAGALVRREVLRHEKSQQAWCSFGADVLRNNEHALSPTEGFAYHAPTGELLWVPEHDRAGLTECSIRLLDEPAPSQREARERLRRQALEALARNLGRVLRWGGSSACSVLAHSVRVAHLAAAVARHLPARPDEVTVAACRRLGALHDLHEGLPGVGDVPNPTLRLLRHAVPAVDAIHIRAEDLVLELAGARSLLVGLAPAAVRFADRLAACVERAAYFGDAPPWLGVDLRRAGERMLRSTLPRFCLRWDAVMTKNPPRLLALAAPGDPPDDGSAASWEPWCEDVLVCLGSADRPWQNVLADMVQGSA